MVALIKICVNMDEEKNKGKWREKQGGEAAEKEKKKKKREKSQLTLGQCVSPTNSWIILSDEKWVMVPNRVGCRELGILSDEWWVTEIEWGVMSDEKKNPNKA